MQLLKYNQVNNNPSHEQRGLFMPSNFTLHLGDCLETLRAMPDNSVDSVVCDPPYGLSKEPDMVEVLRHWLAGDDYTHKGSGFMGKSWDSFVPGPSVWREVLRVLKPGGHLLAFFGTRTQDIGTLAIRMAGFEIRDSIAWVYGSGFPKSMDVSKAIDKAAGAVRDVLGEVHRAGSSGNGATVHQEGGEKSGVCVITAPATDAAAQWQGWGTALKPALEPITVARKPLIGTVAANVLEHGTGAINVDACRVGNESTRRSVNIIGVQQFGGANHRPQHEAEHVARENGSDAGRWPANLIHDGSDEVIACFPAKAGVSAPVKGTEASRASVGNVTGERDRVPGAFHGDAGSAARFFYCAKASRADRNEGLASSSTPALEMGATMREREDADWPARNGNHHPTVKPTDLMAYLCRLVTPPGGTVLDPFMGSGSTGKAAMREGFHFIGCELSPDYLEIARTRIEHERAKVAAAREAKSPEAQPDLFAA
jgi:DNA modification methylase